MTLDEAIQHCKEQVQEQAKKGCYSCAEEHRQLAEWLKELKARREQDSDTISKQAVNTLVDELARAISDERCYMSRGRDTTTIMQDILELPPVVPKLKTGHCKDCKWWKDRDGLYRRGGHAESQCPINRREVFEGNGYCYMFEPQERIDKK